MQFRRVLIQKGAPLEGAPFATLPLGPIGYKQKLGGHSTKSSEFELG